MIVPTLSRRPEYLAECLESIIQAGNPHICIVAPSGFELPKDLPTSPHIQVEIDNGLGLPNAINQAVKSLPETIEHINWLGDDDLLTPGSLMISSAVLDNEPKTVLVFGSCDYVDEDGDVVWRNKSGSWAVPLMRLGPDLIPQPGALFRRSAFEDVGGLSTKYSWAFDFDLFLKLSKKGRLRFVNKTLAKFRWHPESLSVEHRKKSVAEASLVRISHLPPLLRPVSFLWEWPVRTATLIAGNRVTSLSKKKAQTK